MHRQCSTQLSGQAHLPKRKEATEHTCAHTPVHTRAHTTRHTRAHTSRHTRAHTSRHTRAHRHSRACYLTHHVGRISYGHFPDRRGSRNTVRACTQEQVSDRLRGRQDMSAPSTHVRSRRVSHRRCVLSSLGGTTPPSSCCIPEEDSRVHRICCRTPRNLQQHLSPRKRGGNKPGKGRCRPAQRASPLCATAPR